MNKKGQILELIGIVVIVGIAIFGVSKVYFQKDLIYVGDTNLSIAYKYTACKVIINKIPSSNMLVFPAKEDIPSDYKIKECK